MTSEFEKSWKNHRRLMIYFVVMIPVLMVLFGAMIGYVSKELANTPEQIGEATARIVNNYEEKRSGVGK